jgi:hypothetical protein
MRILAGSWLFGPSQRVTSHRTSGLVLYLVDIVALEPSIHTVGFSNDWEAGQRAPLYQDEFAATTLSTGRAFQIGEKCVKRTVLVDLLICQGRSCDESARARSLLSPVKPDSDPLAQTSTPICHVVLYEWSRIIDSGVGTQTTHLRLHISKRSLLHPQMRRAPCARDVRRKSDQGQ